MQVAPVNGAVQEHVSTSLRLLYQSHFPTLAGHPGERRMVDTMSRVHYWPPNANDVYTTLRVCRDCVWTKLSEKCRCPIQKFLTTGSLKLVAMDILGPQPQTSNGNQFVLRMRDRCLNFGRAIPTARTTAVNLRRCLWTIGSFCMEYSTVFW